MSKNTSVTFEQASGYNAKDFILDIKVEINHCMIMNLEMQVVNRHDWSDRSLSYLCRSYDQLNRGQEYTHALPV
ncbi:MAG: PD-(D/E)XK nuclease family transposase, partial [Lachnospiraceae bacterium]|nr:PD-(D/E)XK nuclease family transposase [Lachnospiraceae bacterium]